MIKLMNYIKSKIVKIKESKRFEKRISLLLISFVWFGYIIGSIPELSECLNRLTNSILFLLNMAIIFRTGFFEEKLSKGWNNVISICVSVTGFLAVAFWIEIEHQNLLMNIISAFGMSLTFWYISVQNEKDK